ncbi:MAG TPA: hypothetical protein VMF89_27225 [Polyangiales bacterium]|nr:hypothetical protein [Polyangiales bacterium]
MALAACGGTTAGATTAPPQSSPQQAQSASAFAGTGWEVVRVPEVALELNLPLAAGWRALSGSAWTRLDHPASASLLEVRVLRAERRVKPEDCAARARLERPELPAFTTEDAVDAQLVTAPPGFRAQQVVSAQEAPDAALVGEVSLYAAGVGRCFVAHFITRFSGPAREQEISHRLALVTDRIIPSLRLRDADTRIAPEPFAK